MQPDQTLAQGTNGPQPLTKTNKEIRCDRLDSSAHERRVSAADEMVCLTQLGDIASRRGDQLLLKLTNGKTKMLASGSKACADHNVEKCIVYRLAGFFPAHQMILVYVAVYEGTPWFLLVSRRTGDQVKLLGEPHFSPSGGRVVSMAWDESGESESGLDIWSIKANRPALEWRNRQEAVEFDRWLNDERLAVKMFYGKGHAEVVHANGNWELLISKSKGPPERRE